VFGKKTKKYKAIQIKPWNYISKTKNDTPHLVDNIGISNVLSIMGMSKEDQIGNCSIYVKIN